MNAAIRGIAVAVALAGAGGCSMFKGKPAGPGPAAVAPAAPGSRAQLELEVTEAERAFARTMADRDIKAFGSFIAEDAVFFSEDPPLRGREAVVSGWQHFFVTAQAPFSWSPARVAVNDAGTEALDTGPVMAPDGRTKVGSFTSVWRRGSDGKWKIIWDNGCSCGR